MNKTVLLNSISMVLRSAKFYWLDFVLLHELGPVRVPGILRDKPSSKANEIIVDPWQFGMRFLGLCALRVPNAFEFVIKP